MDSNFYTAFVSPGGTAHPTTPEHLRSPLRLAAPSTDDETPPANTTSEAAPAAAVPTALGSGWWKKIDTAGQPFYVHEETGETTRDKPDNSGSSDSGPARQPYAHLKRLVAPTDQAVPDEVDLEPGDDSDSDSDLTPIDGVGFC